MEIEIKVPDIGADEVEVTEVLVGMGDKVDAEQSLITVEGEKASIEIPSPQSGVVKELKVAVGDKVATGKIIMIFEEIESSTEKPANTSNSIQNKGVKIPDISSNEMEVTEVLVKVGDKVSTDSQIMVFKAEDTAPEPAQSKSEFSENEAYVHATPVIRRLAREFGVNLSKVKSSGRKGRILREDVQKYIKESVKLVETTKIVTDGSILPGLLPWPKIEFTKFGNTKETELSKIQKISGANLYRNWVMVPHVTHFDEADITELEAFRKQQNAEADKKKLDVKITLLVFIIKAVAKGLEELPRFNSSLSEDGKKLVLKEYVNIGVAVDTPNGLVVPVFRDVNKKGIIELSRELREISNKARAGKLTSLDIEGGCFTISNLGGIGSTAFTPIVNAPEVAILGVSKSSTKPVWNGKKFVPRLILPLSLSYDHRVIDGADSARFINFISKVISDIRRLVM